ncbi:phosphatidate cytidylyltransferase [Hydrogenophaga sp.]|jgi:phosphatidate cytidylyltransferase|uniref:phosphatidate cytidylyltransferase n=1 Tax=Hydrogenophaga sp. TaxID=1904254 RepID=UPI00272397C9|nr:phosphatidate cytidylyltransferase [Hydrogenophaga sp.]MDO9252659.1 phosphatidate cytidylyltransferase [Hydrogenophaga sp.]MDP2406443.1 phosphatidate cytidylyltransferase [Hydrogenophaga sp.]MDP3323406.1 phosphatidate cytidylyltransferase [Hydrogenophaga sp.]MDP3885386.1 phosphatidate cytidylyltransferase [Hydrogenophaga sp.]MDZ4177586.1 phosphatidate cytidylyltransferase [Hydrogenophaga sp.]
MLKQRIITALILMAVLLPALFYPSSEPFVLLSLLLIVAAGWEWARLNACAPAMAKAVGLVLGLVLLAFWLLGGLDQTWRSVWLLSSMAWVGLAVVMLRRGVAGWRAWPAAIRLGLGLLLLACAWLALVQARQLGLGFLLSVLSLVWMADIAAYAGGRAFGRRKLAPTLSPGKSWEGAVSGLVGVLLLGLGWLWFDRLGLTDQPSLFTRLQVRGELLAWLAVIGLSAMSVVGDLLESLVKRSAGMKDSSQLLPGHGGVLDRVDALLPVLPLAMMLVTL